HAVPGTGIVRKPVQQHDGKAGSLPVGFIANLECRRAHGQAWRHGWLLVIALSSHVPLASTEPETWREKSTQIFALRQREHTPGGALCAPLGGVWSTLPGAFLWSPAEAAA